MRHGDGRHRKRGSSALSRRLARMERRGDVRILEAMCRRRGMTVWLVGGALRDLLLNRPVAEIDLAIPADPWPLARELEDRGLGTAVALSDVFPRVARVAGRREIDLVELTGGSIEADLGRRDFSVNAMAWELRGRCLVDPFGGVDDLSGRRLRMVSARNLKDDPLRVLRAARLMATHGLRPDRALTEASRSAARRLSSVAPERIRTEIVKLLESATVTGALRWLRRVGAAGSVLDSPAPAGTRRPGFGLAGLDDPSVRRLAPDARRTIRLALIAARLGLSPGTAAGRLTERRFSRQEAGDVAALLELAARARQMRNARDAWSWIRDSGRRRKEALLFVRLLLPSRSNPARRLAALRPRRRIRMTGRDVMEWLGIGSGPRVGALLREVEIESLRGRIRSRRDARRWLVEASGAVGGASPGRPRLPLRYNSTS